MCLHIGFTHAKWLLNHNSVALNLVTQNTMQYIHADFVYLVLNSKATACALSYLTSVISSNGRTAPGHYCYQ